MNMHVLVVDDEILARKRLKNLLKKIDRPIRIDECSNGKEALDFLKSYPIDLLFLDVQMPELNGFEVLQQLPDGKLPPTIFVKSNVTITRGKCHHQL